MNIGQASSRYLGLLPAGQREIAMAEINRFLRRMGESRKINSLTKVEVERYQQNLIETDGDSANRVVSLKAFLTDLKTKKLTDINLGAGLRVRRKGGSSGGGGRAEPNVIELTREGLELIQKQLDHLENEVAPEVREDLSAAYQDHDFRENAPYDEAKRRMGEVQGQITRLKEQIKSARVVEKQVGTHRVGLGSVVVLRDLDYDEEISYTIVGPGEVKTRGDRISIQSPVGSALKDRTVGEVVEVEIPSGTAKYRLERIEKAT